MATTGRPSTALASLEAVPKILSIHEVQRSAPISSPAGTTPRFSSTPPTPGSPEMSRVNSAKRLGDDVVALEGRGLGPGSPLDLQGHAVEVKPEAPKVDFLAEFDPFADTEQRTTPSDPSGAAELDLAAELFAAFESTATGRISPRDEVPRPQRLVAELPVSKVPSTSDMPVEATDASQVAGSPPRETERKEKPPRLVAELEMSQAPDAGRQVTTLRPLPDGCELDAPSLDLSEAPPRRRWEEGRTHRRGRSLDASLRDTALDLQRNIPKTWDIRDIQERDATAATTGPTTSQVRSRSVEDLRSQEAALQRVFPMPEVEAPTAIQAWSSADRTFTPPREVLQSFYRFMQQGDLLLLDAPGQAYLKYCEANSQHEESVGSKSGDAFHGMARSLSLATERVCFEHGVPATREERLDLALVMLESAITHGCKRLGQARSDPTLNNLRLYRPDRFAALMEHVPATGLDALAMTASTGVQQLAAVAGIAPLSLVPSPPAPVTLMAAPAPMGAPPEMDMEIQLVESVELVDDVVPMEASDSGSEGDTEDSASSSASEGDDGDGDDASEDGEGSDAASESSGEEASTPKGAWDSLMALFGW